MIYRKEIERAIMWLFETQNKETFGWSWVKNISPNEQNTAEVVYATALFCDILTDGQKSLINEAVRKWLLMPQKHAVLTVDWAWVGLALSKYNERFETYSPEFDRAFVEKDIAACISSVLSLQNTDGGWGDYKHDASTAFRTSIALIFLKTQSTVKGQQLDAAIQSGIAWLLRLQNEDGGFGNITDDRLAAKMLNDHPDIERSIVENQYSSSLSATGYALWALSCGNDFSHLREIAKAANYLKGLDLSGGYELFLEVGIRRGTLFTFRHFGAAWMGIGLLASGRSRFVSPEIVALVKYFLSLQDLVYGGFKCNDSSEVYTWSDCNALMFMRLAIDSLESMSGIDYTDIIVDYFMK